MKKKTIVAALLMAGIAAGVGTQIHAQDTAYVCGGNHSGMHHTAHECIRTLQEQQAAKAAAEKRQAEAAQKQKAAASASYAKTAAQSDTAVNTDTAVSNQAATELPTSTPAQRTDTTNPAVPDCPYHENCDGTHQHNENCNGNHSFGEDCNNSRQGYHHGGEGGQGMHHGNGHHGR